MAKKRRFGKNTSDSGKRIQGVVFGTVGLLAIIGMIGANLWLKKITPDLDEANCPTDGPKAIHVIMIDRSDPITGQQALRIKQMVDSIANNSLTGERFDFFVFEGNSKAVLEPNLVVCAPGKPEDASEIYQNPEIIRKRYEEGFIALVKKVVDELTTRNELNSSPILESIRSASLWSFGKYKSAEIPMKLTLVSDMVQNSEILSQYKNSSTFEDFENSAEWLSVRPDLKGADVQILYLIRPNKAASGLRVQNRGHQLFWEKLITSSGGRLSSMDIF